jgi:hypothetical protein
MNHCIHTCVSTNTISQSREWFVSLEANNVSGLCHLEATFCSMHRSNVLTPRVNSPKYLLLISVSKIVTHLPSFKAFGFRLYVNKRDLHYKNQQVNTV